MTTNEAAVLLRAHDGIQLVTHTHPDGDTLCSAAALCSMLRRMGKRAWLFPNPEITEKFQPLTAAFLADGSETAAYTVSVDVAGTEMFCPGFSGAVDLAIDHHPKNPGFAAATLLRGEKASTGEIILELADALGCGVTPEEATLLYIALSTDCGCFCYGNTGADTHRAAARLMDLGANHRWVNKQFFRSFSFPRLKLEGMIFATLRSYRDNQINIAVITLDMMRESGATEDDCDDLASLAGKVRGNVVSITVREIAPGRSKASVRTNELVDASAVCAVFGGGGHKMASGCTVDLPPQTLADRMLDTVNEIWK